MLYLTFLLRSKAPHKANREQNHYFPPAGLQTALDRPPDSLTGHQPCAWTLNGPTRHFSIDLQEYPVGTLANRSIRHESRPIRCVLYRFRCGTSSPTRKASNRLRDRLKTLLWQPTAYYYRITKCITDFMHLSDCFSYCYSAYLFTNLLAFRIKCWRASVTIALLRCERASALLVLHVL